MKILHINGNYIYTSLHQLMTEGLTQRGYTNKVYVPVYDKSLAVINPNDNVVISECFKRVDRVLFGYKQRKIIHDAVDRIDCSSYDCIHAYTLFTDGNTAMELSKKYDIPFVVAIRNVDVNSFFSKMVHLRRRGIEIMRRAKVVFFLSEAYREQVFDKYVPKKYREELMEKTYIVPNGIDEFWFENIPQGGKTVEFDKEIRLVFAGRIDKNKNVTTTQKAMQLLREKGYNVSLTVVGKVQDESEVEKIKSDKYTKVLDAMPKEKLIDVYRSSDIFVMPSFTESFGLVYAEAMSQGLPVVYSAGQGFDGQFAEGEVGYRVDSHSPESVAEGILKVIENYGNISPYVSQKVKKFSWDEIVKEYSDIYEKIGGTK